VLFVFIGIGLVADTRISPAMASPADDYTNAVHRALSLVQFGERGDAPSVKQAITTLMEGTGHTQPEVLRDLEKSPPDLNDADQRLSALYASLQSRVDTPNPDQARQQLHSILSQPRYSGLSTGPSLLDQIMAFILGKISDLLVLLGINRLHLGIPLWLWLVIGALAVLAIIVWPIRSGLSRGGREVRLRAAGAAPRPRIDFFAEADRLASSSDYVGAIKALAGGVAIRLRGEQAWSRSPLTVRELFQHSERADALRPLLLTFEQASYGHREPDAETYARAVQAAEPFRQTAA
jgi:uncharacterized protein DUF4129